MTIRASEAALPFLESCGVTFQPSLTGTLSLSRTNAFFLGGGKALLNAVYRTAEKLGVDILYDTEVREVLLEDGFAREVPVVFPQDRIGASRSPMHVKIAVQPPC